MQLGGIVGDKVEVPDGLLDQQTVEQLLKKAKLSLDEEEVEKALKKARYKVLDVIYNVSHDESERLLKRELVDHLYARGYSDEDFEVVKNEKSGRYEVIDKKGENLELKAENFRLIEEIPKLFTMTSENSYYNLIKKSMPVDKMNSEGILLNTEDVYTVDGEIYKIIKGAFKRSFIILPDGKQSELFTAPQSFHKTERGLIYQANLLDKHSNWQWFYNNQRIYEGNDWMAGGEIINNVNAVSIDCWLNKKVCDVAQANVYDGMLTNGISYYDIIEWSSSGQITAISSSLCEDQTLKADIKTKVVTLTESKKQNANPELCVQSNEPFVLKLGSRGY